ncbi:MAG: glutamate--cysteine ligase [Nitratireductor sp.]|nr:glutamate--cysteine ligase [Nitratireductor sp.]
MARDTVDERPLESVDEMIQWFAQGCKPKEDWRIGTEHEKFAFYTDSHGPVPYDGDRGIEALLKGMQAELGWEAITDDGRIIGLAGGDGEGAISIEPGGQFELSGAPLETIHQTCAESNRHLRAVKAVGKALGMGFLGLGSSPVWTEAQTPRMPKSRYKIMANYMPKVGTRGLDMMFRTATIQANLDFSDEADMKRKLQVSLRLQPLVTALFANSPFTDGRPNGELSWRAGVWRDVDNQRGGYQPQMLDPDFGFEAYAQWCLDIPMYFIIRDGKYIDMTHITFRDFFKGGAAKDMPGVVPTIGDWSNHVSTLFPDVRLKRFLEMRGADGGPWRRICALPALWAGLLYDDQALGEAEEYVAGWSAEAVGALRESVPQRGLLAEINGQSMQQAGKDILKIAGSGLERRNHRNSEGLDERLFLVPLEEVVYAKRTSADNLLWMYSGPWQQDIDRIFAEMAY